MSTTTLSKATALRFRHPPTSFSQLFSDVKKTMPFKEKSQFLPEWQKRQGKFVEYWLVSEDLPKVVVKWKPTYWEIYLPLSQDPMETCEYNNSENATTLAGLMLKNKFQLQGCMYCTWQVLPTMLKFQVGVEFGSPNMHSTQINNKLGSSSIKSSTLWNDCVIAVVQTRPFSRSISSQIISNGFQHWFGQSDLSFDLNQLHKNKQRNPLRLQRSTTGCLHRATPWRFHLKNLLHFEVWGWLVCCKSRNGIWVFP